MNCLDFEARLYPGESSQVGFLAPGETLDQVIQDDTATAAKYGVTLYQVGCVLERMVLLHHQGQRIIDDKYRVIPGISTCGYQECPFEELDSTPITYGRSTIQLERIDTGERFKFEALVAHLVKEHSFCEGPSTPYRLDLEGAIRFFDITPGIDYTPQSTRVQKWDHFQSSTYNDRYQQYESLAPLALARYTNRHFVALVFPGEISFMEEEIEISESDYLTKWYQYLLSRAHSENNSWLAEAINDVKSEQEINEKVQIQFNTIKSRIHNFQNGILDDGLVVVLLANLDFDYPIQGLMATPLPERAARFEIPDLKFNLIQNYFRIPSVHMYRLKSVIQYK